jgi:hypothetical protein
MHFVVEVLMLHIHEMRKIPKPRAIPEPVPSADAGFRASQKISLSLDFVVMRHHVPSQIQRPHLERSRDSLDRPQQNRRFGTIYLADASSQFVLVQLFLNANPDDQ